jgi:prolyl 4-hydroxylase
VFQGGQWIWPGVSKGFQRHIRLDQAHNATLETLSLHPLVLSVQGFLSEEECDWIQEEAAPSMRYSEVSLMDKDKGRPASDFRTSQTTFLTTGASSELNSIDSRTASLVRIPTTHQEPAQVLRYGQTEKYDTHHDYFTPSLYQNDKRTLQLIQNGRRNRMATVFWYLSDVEEGGETVFPRMDKARQPSEQKKSCQVGLRVRPEKGKVIIFYSMTPDGELDPFSLHGACPVKEGVKWAANKWVWNAPL